MFEYEIIDNRTDIILGNCIFIDDAQIDIDSHMISDLNMGHEIQFEAKTSKEKIIIRPSFEHVEVFLVVDNHEHSLTKCDINEIDMAVFLARSYID